jgi:hypothetical protein
MRNCVFIFVVMFSAYGWSQPTQPTTTTRGSQQFDGKWWSKTSTEEHSGFINGAADCLTWTAHQKGFNATPEQLTGKIGKFYREHPGSANLPVIEVWKRIWDRTRSSRAAAQPGETWSNPHWYLDGFWWLDQAPDEKQGFVEGYLWCLRTQVGASTDTYSKSPGFYVEKIDSFAMANSNTKADRESVASILRRYRDKPASVKEK